ncbi:MAG: DUF3040 domain-containing protein [Acidimicrobiales bacterium]
MTDDAVRHALEEMERGLEADDPAYLHRLRCLERHEALIAAAMFALLAAGAVLLTVGLATFTVAAWVGGLVALAAAVLVDRRHHRNLP